MVKDSQNTLIKSHRRFSENLLNIVMSLKGIKQFAEQLWFSVHDFRNEKCII